MEKDVNSPVIMNLRANNDSADLQQLRKLIEAVRRDT